MVKSGIRFYSDGVFDDRFATDAGELSMAINGVRGSERRRAKRINVSLPVKIVKAARAKGDRWNMEWVDVGDLKDISHLGAYFIYRGRQQLNRDDILRINLDVNFPFDSKEITVSERLPLGGLASIVRTQSNPRDASVGVGVKFLEPLLIFNSH